MGHKRTQTPKELALEVEISAAVVLGGVLGKDAAFLARVEKVREKPDPAPAAWREAAAYVSRGAGRRAIARLLEVAAAEPDPRLIHLRLMNYGTKAVWSEEPLMPGEPRRFLREELYRDRRGRRATYRFGAELLARRGAGRCLECGTPLARDRTLAHSRGRRDYCSPCEPKVHFKRAQHWEAIHTVLRDATDWILGDEGPRQSRARRQRRSST